MGERPPGTSIDRIDGTKGYFKGNCRWATAKQQANNVRTNRRVDYEGVSLTISELAEKLGLKYDTLRMRIITHGEYWKTGKKVWK